jgi:tetratricopeptide (TPR) repeat protein
MNKGIFILPCFFFICMTAVSNQNATADISPAQPIRQQDSEISELYLREAFSLANHDRSNDALLLLETALNFNPYNSDVFFLLAKLNKESTTDTLSNIKYLESAVEYDNFSLFSKADCKKSLIKYYLQIKEFEAARKLFNEDFIFIEDSPEEILIAAKIQNGLKNYTVAVSLYKKGIALYPEDFRFRLELLRLQEIPTFDDIVWIERYIAGLDINSLATDRYLTEYILTTVQSMKDSTLKTKLIQAYYDIGGTSPHLIVSGLYTYPDQTLAVHEFIEIGGLQDLSALRNLYHSLEDMRSRNLLKAELQNISAVYSQDLDHDGFFEKVSVYSEGDLIQFSEDINQDGVSEMNLRFEAGLPTVLTILNSTGFIDIEYDLYPGIHKITFSDSDGKSVYHLIPNSISYQIFSNEILPKPDDLPAVLYPFLLNLESAPPFEAELHTSALSNERFRKEENQPYIKEEYDSGEIIRIFEDIDSDGFFENKIILKSGMPEIIERDIDADNKRELKEIYTSGTLSSILFNGNDDGYYETKTGP